MAQSLVCKDCNAFLRSVKEAQDHADATGHTNFEESTEAVKKLVCDECGKVCRNDTEKDLHTKRTGHSTFEDKTGDQTDVIDTEQQMAEARKATTDTEDHLVPAEVDDQLLDQLTQMGFERNRAIRAIYSSGGDSVESAIVWIDEHQDDIDIDEPLMVPKSTAKEKLTPEEAKFQAQDLIRKAKERREAEEKERERLRELERVRAGKELAAIARKEEEARFRLMAEERQREKEEEARAREKIRRKLEEDRRERRRKLGLPEELTEEEKEEERRREKEKAEAEAKRRLPVKPVVKSERMRQLLVKMKQDRPGQDDALKICYSTLLKLVTNLGNSPTEEKYRKIRLGNAAIQQRFGLWMDCCVEFLEICGFVRSGEEMEVPADAVDRLVLEAAAENLNSAVSNPFFGML